MSTARRLPGWPLYLIGAPAAVAVWSGWVGLGQLSGFGIIHPLPGLWDSATVNTAITLPIGVEAYGAYALGAWLTPGTPQAARKFAKWSAIGALTLGMMGQVAYHLLSAGHATRAPWPVVVLVSSLPVIVLGFGAALSHLLRGEDGEAESAPEVNPEAEPESALLSESVSVPSEPVPALASAPLSAPEAAPRAARTRAKATVKKIRPPMPAEFYAAELAAGELPSLRRIRADLHVGQDKAKVIQTELTMLLTERVPVAA